MKFKENHSGKGPIIVCKQKNILQCKRNRFHTGL